MSDYTPLPTVAVLLEELKEVDNWFTLGTYLNVPVYQLNKIQSTHTHDGVERCKLEMLQYWLVSTMIPSWKDIVRALEQLNMLALTERLKLKYLRTLPATIPLGGWSHDVRLRASKKEQQQQSRLATVLQESEQKDLQLSDVSMKMHSYKANYEQQLVLQQQLQSQLAIVQQESQQKDHKISDISTKMHFYKEKYEQQKKELEMLQQKVIQARLLLEGAVQQDETESGRISHQVPTADCDPFQRVPAISDLLNLVAARANEKWKLLGLQLKLSLQQLNSIEEKCKQAILCYAEIFQLWQNKGDPPFTWGTIINALKAPSVGEAKLATELQEMLHKQ